MKKNKKTKREVCNFKDMERWLAILAELVKSDEELEELIKQLDLRILPLGNKDYVCEAIFYQTDDNEQLMKGKWRFMLAAKKAVKEAPCILHKIETEGLNVDDIDASLGEIRERLGCKVCKLYSNGFENYIVEGDDFTSCPNTFRRIGWAVLSHELCNKKKEEL